MVAGHDRLPGAAFGPSPQTRIRKASKSAGCAAGRAPSHLGDLLVGPASVTTRATPRRIWPAAYPIRLKAGSSQAPFPKSMERSSRDPMRFRRQKRSVGYPRPMLFWKRAWLEPAFNLIGLCAGQILAGLPWSLRWRADQQIARWLGARPAAQPADF